MKPIEKREPADSSQKSTNIQSLLSYGYGADFKYKVSPSAKSTLDCGKGAEGGRGRGRAIFQAPFSRITQLPDDVTSKKELTTKPNLMEKQALIESR